MNYSATATFAGPISAAQAEQLLRRLHGYAPRFDHLTRVDGDMVDLTFTIRGGSDREAVIRAFSLCDDLGHRLARLSVNLA